MITGTAGIGVGVPTPLYRYTSVRREFPELAEALAQILGVVYREYPARFLVCPINFRTCSPR